MRSGITSNTESKLYIENTEDIVTLSKSYEPEDAKEARIMQ